MRFKALFVFLRTAFVFFFKVVHVSYSAIIQLILSLTARCETHAMPQACKHFIKVLLAYNIHTCTKEAIFRGPYVRPAVDKQQNIIIEFARFMENRNFFVFLHTNHEIFKSLSPVI